MGKLITVPFGWLLTQLYQLTNSYGWALIIFAVLVKLILLPVTAKSKKSTMKMSRMTPRIKEIQEKYANDQQKQGEAIQALYKAEGVSMFGGCLWGLVPLLILIPLYTVVREPIVYMLGETADVAKQIIDVIKEAAPTLFTANNFYDQMIAAQQIPNFLPQLEAAGIALNEVSQQGVNFMFLGIDLAKVPQINVFAWEAWTWGNIGLLLMPLLSAGSQVLSMILSQKQNNSLVTNEKGVYDKETAEKSQANQTGKTMMWLMPLMSLWIGFSMPAAMSLYWLIQGIVTTIMDIFLTRHYRKIYDAEDAERLAKHMEAERIEEEKERLRAERRAANPEGITENTSKKKLQQAKKAEQEAAKAAAAKEYAAKRGIVEEEPEAPKKIALSGISERPWCKGRAYDPNRYSSAPTEEE